MSTTIVVLGVILLVILFLTLFSDYFSGTTSQKEEKSLAKDSVSSIPATDLTKPDASRFTYSIWLYVDSWNTNTEKVVFHREYDTKLYLDENNSKLMLKCGSSESTGDTYSNTIEVVNNYPLQKWVHILISYDNNICDIYLDGKMVKSVQLSGDPAFNVSMKDKSIGFGSGWDAYISKFERKPNPTDPKTAYDMYREGSGATSLGKALGNYNVNLSFLKDNVETSKFALF